MRDIPALLRLIAERQAMPFAWGSEANDCVSFAANAVRAQTGRDVLKPLKAKWSTELGAAKTLARLGGLEAAVDRVLTPVPLGMARRGDIAMAGRGETFGLFVVEGQTIVGPDIAGLSRLPRRMAVKAWSAE